MNLELHDVQDGFTKGRASRDQTANIHWIIKKARDFQKNITFCFIDYAKAYDGESESESHSAAAAAAAKSLQSCPTL